MPLQMPRANRFAELKWPQHHEQKSGNNMNHGQNRVPSKHFVQCHKLRGSGAGRNRGRTVTSAEDCTEVNDSADGDCGAKEREKNDSAPECATEANSGLHTVYYAPLV